MNKSMHTDNMEIQQAKLYFPSSVIEHSHDIPTYLLLHTTKFFFFHDCQLKIWNECFEHLQQCWSLTSASWCPALSYFTWPLPKSISIDGSSSIHHMQPPDGSEQFLYQPICIWTLLPKMPSHYSFYLPSMHSDIIHSVPKATPLILKILDPVGTTELFQVKTRIVFDYQIMTCSYSSRSTM